MLRDDVNIGLQRRVGGLKFLNVVLKLGFQGCDAFLKR
jgi:hypothetical protein